MRRPAKKQETGIFSLNITSMTDMFTLLLVFLLQTYATSEVRVDMPADIKMPVSSVEKDPTKIPQVTISPTEIKVDGDIVVSLENGQVKKEDLEGPNMVKPLFEALKGKLSTEPNANDAVLLLADASQDMTALNPFLSTIAAAGFSKVKLATVLGR